MPASGINIVFFGTETFSLAALQALVEGGYTVSAVVTKPDRPHGRGLQLRAPAVKTYADEHGIKVFQPERLQDIESVLSAIEDRIGILSSYGKIIPASILALFERGIINIHPSLLPTYRGPSPIETAIANGDSQTGVSLMRLVATMDSGPVYTQRIMTLTGTERANELYTKCAQTGSNLLIENLPAIISGDLQPHPQVEADATYTRLLNKKGALVNPASSTAHQIERHVRAYEEYPRTRISIHGHEVIITDVHVGQPNPSELAVRCAHDSWLVIDRLIAPSGTSVSGSDFRHGYGN